jgi:hypothetical protein
MITILIYTLSNPLTGNPFYIGRTTKLSARLCGHILDATNYKSKKGDIIRNIANTGLKPTIEEVDRIECKSKLDEKRANDLEEYWINQFRAWGFDLVNTFGIKIKYKESLKIKWERHDKEFGNLLEREIFLKRALDRLYNKLMPDQMDTPLGRKVWIHDIKKEKTRLLAEIKETKERIFDKKTIYNNQLNGKNFKNEND